MDRLSSPLKSKSTSLSYFCGLCSLFMRLANSVAPAAPGFTKQAQLALNS